MNGAIERLESLLVSDVMTKVVVQAHCHQTVGEVADIFARHDISAAPVVDEEGRCAGIVSATDFINPGEGQEAGEPAKTLQDVWQDRVDAYMTRQVHCVGLHAPLLSAARIMCNEHIHRLLVLDEEERPGGVISTMDVVAAVLNAIEEMNAAQG